MISPKSIEEIKNAMRVEEVLGEFLDLRRAGVNLKGRCPFHDEKTPSFVVSPAKGIYKCFGCGMAGDSVRFLMDHEKLSYPEALRWIAEKYSIELEETAVSSEVRAELQKQDSLFIINGFAQKTYHEHMMESQDGRLIGLSYFKERGFLEKTVNQWGLGYAPDDRHFLFNGLKENSYNLELAHELGLLKNNRDFFYSRIIFPIRNLSGKVIGVGARTLSSDKKIPKYINSPESEIYNKRKTLFGLYFAKTAIRKQDSCFIVEGYTDVISLHQNGVENVVASSGTSLTVEQIQLIKRFSENVTVLFDGDNAGIKAALRGLDLILEQDMNVKLLLLPEGEDPDSFIKANGSQKFKEYTEENAKDFIIFKIDLLLSEAGNDPVKRSKVIKDIVSSISKIADPLKRNEYIKQGARLLELNESMIQKEANKYIEERIKKENQKKRRESFQSESNWSSTEPIEREDTTRKLTVDSDEHQEKDIIRILMTLGDKYIDQDKTMTVAQYLFNEIYPILETFENNSYKLVIEDIPKLNSKHPLLTPQVYLSHPDQDIAALAIEVNAEKYIYANWRERGIDLQTQPMPIDNFLRDSINSILRLKNRKLLGILQENRKDIERLSAENSPELSIKLKVYQKLMEDITTINKILGSVVLKAK